MNYFVKTIYNLGSGELVYKCQTCHILVLLSHVDELKLSFSQVERGYKLV